MKLLRLLRGKKSPKLGPKKGASGQTKQAPSKTDRLEAELKKLRREVAGLREELVASEGRIVRDRHRHEHAGALGKYGVGYRVDINRFTLAQRRIVELIQERGKIRFLDAGGRDGKLKNLFGGELTREYFAEHAHYTGMDLHPGGEDILGGDICSDQLLDRYPEMLGSFDVVYSNNVFEHLINPFAAMQNLHRLLSPGGITIVNAPFAWRYHEVPQDYFRYTHSGLVALLTVNGISDFEVLDSGYDIRERRRNLNGLGQHNGHFQNDVCPEDEFGAWREHWQTVLIYKKTAGHPPAGERSV